MSNEVLWILYLIFDFSFAIGALVLLGRAGLYAVIIASLIICNIQVQKFIDMGGITLTLGNIAYGGIFFATDLLGECYGKDEAKKAVFLGFFALLFTAIAFQLTLLFTPSASDMAHPHMAGLFALTPRIFLGSMVAYICSQYHDVWAFHYWKNKTGNRHLWLRNNFSTLASQFIDTAIFVSIAFMGVFPWPVLLSAFTTTLFFKCCVALLDTPFIYLGKYIIENKPKTKWAMT